MAASYYNANWKEWYVSLQPCVEHVHVSDAAGTTSEGLMFGEGIIGNFSDILMINKLKIIESNHEDPIPTMLEIEELMQSLMKEIL